MAPTILNNNSIFLPHQFISRARIWGRDSLVCLNFYLKFSLFDPIFVQLLIRRVQFGATNLTGYIYGKVLFSICQILSFCTHPSAWLHIMFFYNFDLFSIFSNLDLFFSNACPDLYIFSTLASKFVFIFFQILIWNKFKNLILFFFKS